MQARMQIDVVPTSPLSAEYSSRDPSPDPSAINVASAENVQHHTASFVAVSIVAMRPPGPSVEVSHTMMRLS